ncbi:MAG: bifunctional nicotinamidase/pyrazinamidase [Thermoanaerobaculia bacterium]
MKRALVLVDIQNDFIPGGALAVAEGHEVVPVANRVAKEFEIVVATQDWHPENHGSFASQHEGKNPGETIELGGIPQVLWPDHCVQDSRGAEFHPDLDTSVLTKVFRKGTDPAIDSYSGFFDNGHLRSTGMGEWLREEGVTDIWVMGLATDYCVKFTALDGVKLELNVRLIEDGCRGVKLEPQDSESAIEEMRVAGVEIVTSDALRLE